MNLSWTLSGLAALALSVVVPAHLRALERGGEHFRWHGTLGNIHDARGPQVHSGTVFERVHEVMAQLDLTDAQRRAVARIAGEGQARYHRLVADSRLSPQQRHAKVQELHMAMLKSIHGTLTPAQLGKVHEVMKNLHGGLAH